MNLKTAVTAAMLAASALFAAGCESYGHERTAGNVLDDSTITTRVKSALLAEKDVNSFDIKVKTYNGIVQLSGFVESEWQIKRAEQVASSIEGVKSVTNDLIHKPQK